MIRIPNHALTSAAVVFLLNPGCFPPPRLVVPLGYFLEEQQGEKHQEVQQKLIFQGPLEGGTSWFRPPEAMHLYLVEFPLPC